MTAVVGAPCLQENYGKDEEAAVQKVKEVYRQLDLEGVFRWGGATGWMPWHSL